MSSWMPIRSFRAMRMVSRSSLSRCGRSCRPITRDGPSTICTGCRRTRRAQRLPHRSDLSALVDLRRMVGNEGGPSAAGLTPEDPELPDAVFGIRRSDAAHQNRHAAAQAIDGAVDLFALD